MTNQHKSIFHSLCTKCSAGWPWQRSSSFAGSWLPLWRTRARRAGPGTAAAVLLVAGRRFCARARARLAGPGSTAAVLLAAGRLFGARARGWLALAAQQQFLLAAGYLFSSFCWWPPLLI